MDIRAYTYLVRCTVTGQKYYGVRYGEQCCPTQLWTTYFTSSKNVHSLIEQHGVDQFSVSIRKTFVDTEKARRWEHKVLRRLKVCSRTDWINQTDNVAFEPLYGDTNPARSQRTREFVSWFNKNHRDYSQHHFKTNNPAKTQQHKEKLSETKSGKMWVKNEHTSKMVNPEHVDYYLQRGYSRGKRCVKGRNKGKVYIHTDATTKAIHKQNLTAYLNAGWKRGKR